MPHTQHPQSQTIFRTRALSVGPLTPKTADPSVEQRGVLYYYQDPSLSDLAGEVRFRYCNDVSEFDKGEDHKDSPLRTWRIPLHDIARFERHMPLRQLLIEDELVSEDVMDDLADLTALREGAWLYRLDQPFVFELSKPRLEVTFVTRRSATPCCFENLHRDGRVRATKGRPVAVYSGETACPVHFRYRFFLKKNSHFIYSCRNDSCSLGTLNATRTSARSSVVNASSRNPNTDQVFAPRL